MRIKVLQLDDDFVDGNGDIMPTYANIKFNEKILLNKNFSSNIEEVIGLADLTREGNSFYIQNLNVIELPDDVLKKLTPAIGGKILIREGNVVTAFTIDMVSLNLDKNTDPNIKSIGEQTNE